MSTTPVSSQTPSNQPNVKNEGVCSKYLPMAIGIIIMLGAVFILLASDQVLPPFPNVISDLGVLGEVIGYCLLGLGCLGAVFAWRRHHPDPLSSQAMGKILIESMDKSLERMQRENLERVQRNINVENADAAIVKLRPKRISDGEVLYNDAMVWTTSYVSQFVIEINALIILNLSMPENAKVKMKNEEIETKLSQFIIKFKELYEKGKNTNHSIPPNSCSVAIEKMMRDTNKRAADLNQSIDECKAVLAKKLAEFYQDSKSPPPNLETPTCEAWRELAASWQSHLAKVKRAK
jgi:hypothetical protein